MLVFKTTMMPTVYAANNMTNATSASVTVNGFVDVTIQNAPVTFGPLNPGTVGTAANNSPMNITYTILTNVPVETYLNGSVFTDGGTNSFLVGNLSFNVTVSATGLANGSCNTSRCRYTLTPMFVFNETAPSGGLPKNASVYHYIDIPSGQAPAAYTAQLRVCTEQLSVVTCRT